MPKDNTWDLVRQLDALIADAEAPPSKARDCSIHIRMTKEERRRLKWGAAARGMNCSAYICRLIEEDVDAAE